MKNLLAIVATSVALSVGSLIPASAKDAKTPPRSLKDVPNKVALANWPKPKPHTTSTEIAAKKLNAKARHFAKAESTEKSQNFKCGILAADSWDEDYPNYGAFSFSLSDPNTFTRHYVNSDAPANGGGFFTEDKYYFTSYQVDDWGWDYDVYTYVIDTNTWSVTSKVDQGSMYALATDLAYDPIEKVAFGTFYDGSDEGSYWGYMNPDDCSIVEIASLDTKLVAVAANNQGEIYGITSAGALVKVDKYSGAFTTIVQTSASLGYLQSAAFDDNGNLYWAACFSDGSTGLFSVDYENGKFTLINAFDDEQELVALYAEPAEADAGAPAEALNLALSFVNDALTGSVSFDIPAVDNTGEAMTGDITYIINVDGEDLDAATAQAGTTVNTTITVASAGVHSVSVRLSNDKGESKRVSVSQWIGIDRPVAVTDLVMEKTGELQATLSWTAPTKGALDGYFDANRLSYTVTRLPEGKVVVEGLKETTFVDNIDADYKVYLTYKVTPYADNVAGAATESNGAIFGHSLDVPVEFNFDTEADYNIFTVIDNNETLNLDSGMWQYSPSGQCAGYVCGTKDGDDWLITPEINLKADRQYTFSYDVLCYSQTWPDSYELYMGTDATIEGMTTKLVEPTTIYWDEYRTNTLTITVAQDGTYNFGFHALSEAGGAFFLVDNIKLVESFMLKAPETVQNLTATAGAKGELSATVKFNAPSKAVDGTELTAVKDIKLYRDADLVKTFENPTPGEELTFSESDLTQGYVTYRVVASTEAGEGDTAQAQIWVGFDLPAAPEVFATVNSDSHPVITWTASPEVGVNGGYVDVDQLTYLVYRAQDDAVLADASTDFTLTDTETTIVEQGAQSMLLYAVYPQAKEGYGTGSSAFVLNGAPYGIPFAESFANASTNQLWLIDGTEGDYWQIVNDWSADPQDDDSGLLLMTPNTPGSVSTIVSGKISLKSAKNAQLSFYLEPMSYMDNEFAETDANDDYLEVLVATEDYQLKPVLTIYPNKLDKGEYLQQIVSLKEFEGSDFCLVGFRMHNVAAQCPLAIDNISITNNYDVNLAVTAFSIPDEVNVTDNFTANVTVKNDAVNDAKDFKVQILRGDEVVAETVEAETLAAGESRSYPLLVTVTREWADSEDLTALAVIAGDEYEDDDDFIATIKVARPDMPAVTDLAGSVNDQQQAVFTWSEPQIAAAATVYEGFESYAHGKASAIGDWTVICDDGVYGVDDITANGEYLDIPHPMGRQSFQVIDPSQLGIDLAANPQWTSHSGSKMIVSFRNWELDNDDWLISPKLSGAAQTITFWARSPKNNKDKMVVLYSKDGNTTSDFTRFEDGRVTLTNEWVQYSFDLEEGTQYFAVRNNQTGGEAIMLDDFVFQTAATWAVAPVVEGYNLYKDDELVNSALITETTFTVTENIAGTYTVKVLYNVGESEASNAVQIDETGVANISVDATTEDQVTYDLYGRRVRTLTPGQIYVRRGEKFIYRTK